jgi:hypothetical protein
MTTLSRIDRAALQLALDMYRRRGRQERERVDAELQRESWLEVAQDCARREQHRNLRLRPWQPAPCQANPNGNGPDDGVMGGRAAELLLARMLELGVSRWHPDPISVIETAEARRVTARAPSKERPPSGKRNQRGPTVTGIG